MYSYIYIYIYTILYYTICKHTSIIYIWEDYTILLLDIFGRTILYYYYTYYIHLGVYYKHTIWEDYTILYLDVFKHNKP